MKEAPKKRKANFTEIEMKCMLTEVSKRQKVFLGKFDSGVTSKAKEIAWDAVTAAVNSVRTTVWTRKDTCHKYCDFKSSVKKTEAQRRRQQTQTGGRL